jgi:hypothetical protein
MFQLIYLKAVSLPLHSDRQCASVPQAQNVYEAVQRLEYFLLSQCYALVSYQPMSRLALFRL